MADNNSNRGLASVDEETRERAARAGAEAQPTEAKAKGDHNSHRGRNS